MFNLGNVLDLPMIWGGLIALAVFVYVLLDGFDLGCGLLYPFAPNTEARNRMMNSIAPFWDGNETWLVLGGGGLFAAFPVAYGIIMSGLYIPVTLMLFGLIFRGVAFEFRFKSDTSRHLWDKAFFWGSFVAAFMQGMMLGALIQGLQVTDRLYSGGGFDWYTPFSIMTGFAVVIGYGLLGATWLIMKTEHDLQAWARDWAKRLSLWLLVAMVVVTLATPFLGVAATDRLFAMPNVLLLAPLPIITALLFFWMRKSLATSNEYRPFLLTMGIFLLGYVGIAITIFPYIVPYAMTVHEAAAADTSLSIMLVGAVIMLPIILSYTAYAYYVFRGKAGEKAMY